jgi:hypothetical protein
MKRLSILLLALSFLSASVPVSFAGDNTPPPTKKKKKSGKKKTTSQRSALYSR